MHNIGMISTEYLGLVCRYDNDPIAFKSKNHNINLIFSLFISNRIESNEGTTESSDGVDNYDNDDDKDDDENNNTIE